MNTVIALFCCSYTPNLPCDRNLQHLETRLNGHEHSACALFARLSAFCREYKGIFRIYVFAPLFTVDSRSSRVRHLDKRVHRLSKDISALQAWRAPAPAVAAKAAAAAACADHLPARLHLETCSLGELPASRPRHDGLQKTTMPTLLLLTVLLLCSKSVYPDS